MFARGVISFRRGLMNPHTAEDFKSYLTEEVVKGSSGSHKKVVGTKVKSSTRTRKCLISSRVIIMCFLFQFPGGVCDKTVERFVVLGGGGTLQGLGRHGEGGQAGKERAHT